MAKDSDFIYDGSDDEQVKPPSKKKMAAPKTKPNKDDLLVVLTDSSDADDEPLSPRVGGKRKNKGKARAVESSDEEEARAAKKSKTREQELADLEEAVNAVVTSANSGAMSKLEVIGAKIDLQQRARALGVNWSAKYAHHFAPVRPSMTPAANSPRSTPNPYMNMKVPSDDVKPSLSNSTDEILRRAEQASRARVSATPYESSRSRAKPIESSLGRDALDLARERRRKRLERAQKARVERAAKVLDSDEEGASTPKSEMPPPPSHSGQMPGPSQHPAMPGGIIPPPAALASDSQYSDENQGPIPAPQANPFALPDESVFRRRRGGDEDDDEDFFVTEEDIMSFDRIALMPEFEKSRTVNEAVAELGLSSQTDRLPGTRFTLVPFQFISVNWMIKQEQGRWQGGILGDEMGLGKTVQALSVCMTHRSKHPDCKTTLIVCPLALLHQWNDEIQSKCIGQTVHIYHGSNKSKVKRAKDLLQYDFVITTLSTLALEWEDPKKSFKESGILYDVLWYRVVLDEAHNIRNRSTRASKAVCQLDTVLRWALTGSPLVNNLADYFPLFRYLRIKPWSAWFHYNDMICKNEKRDPKRAADIAERAIRPCIIRRRKTDLLDGKPLVRLEPKTVEFVPHVLDDDERAIYDALESKVQVTVSKYFKKGAVLKNMAHIFTLLLRLRQAAVHPSLISVGGESNREFLLAELDRARKQLGYQRCEQLRRQILEACVEAERERRTYEEADCDGEEDLEVGQECPICFDAILQTRGIVTRCGHAFCRECIMNILNGDPFENDADVEQMFRCKENEQPCPTCRRPVSPETFFDYDAFRPSQADIEAAVGAEPSTSAREQQQISVMRNVIQLDDDDDDDLPTVQNLIKMTAPKYVKEEIAAPKIAAKKKAVKPDPGADQKPGPSTMTKEEREEAELKKSFKVDGGSRRDRNLDDDEKAELEDLIPSSKMVYIYKTLRAWKEEDPKIKTIIVSSFTSALDLLDSYLTSKRIRCVRFQGDCNADDRKEAIRRLKEDPKVRVMLLSLKAGGVGLNLVSACRVISVDIAWSPAVEAQAFDRVHRLGQERPVLVQRLIAADTVEERIKILQERKQTMSDLTLSEGVAAAGNREGVSIPELLSLFRMDSNGRRLEKANNRQEREQQMRDALDGLLDGLGGARAAAAARARDSSEGTPY